MGETWLLSLAPSVTQVVTISARHENLSIGKITGNCGKWPENCENLQEVKAKGRNLSER
jgi:hypothetical protein